MGLRLKRYGPNLTIAVVSRFLGTGVPADWNVLIDQTGAEAATYNYERREHGGVTYFISGGGAAHAYPIERAPDDPFQSKEINYYYLLVEVDRGSVKITMHRLNLTSGNAVWTEPDSITISAAAARARLKANRQKLLQAVVLRRSAGYSLSKYSSGTSSSGTSRV